MRPGQKNRMRGGRNNNNNSSGGGSRRGPNPLTRSYESNGPDVKVRGTPQHIAEKYVQLARDAHSSSDTVMAESYLQHAEHYYRIISAAQNAQQIAYNQANGIPNAADDTDDEDEFEVAGSDRFTFRTPQSFQQPGSVGYQPPYQPGQAQPYAEGGEQPVIGEGQPMEGGQPPYQPQPRGERPPFGARRPFEDRGDRQERGDRPERQDRSERGDRPERQDRPDRGDRNGRRFGRDRPFGEPRQAGDRPAFAPRDPEAAMMDRAQEQPGLPSFITAPVRPVMTDDMAPMPAVALSAAPEGSGEIDACIRPRRRRLRKDSPVAAEGGDDAV
jgi:hypothetical protein